MSAVDDRSRKDVFGCPECGQAISLVRLESKEDIKEFGCGLRVPFVGVCQRCSLVWSKSMWHQAKSRIS